MKLKYFFILLIIFILSGCNILPLKDQEKPVSDSTGKKAEEIITAEETIDISQGDILLSIMYPTDGASVKEPDLVLLGKTDALAEVAINDFELLASQEGAFSQKLSLDEGENHIIIVANDELGNFAEKELIVYYEPDN